MTIEQYNFYHTASKVIFFGALFLFLFLFIKQVNAILTPFVLSFVLSYLFSPVKDKLVHKFKIRNNFAAGLITVSVVLIVLVALFFILPFTYHQVIDLIQIIPNIFKFLELKVVPFLPSFVGDAYVNSIKNINFEQATNALLSLNLSKIFSKAYSSGIIIIGFVSTIVLTPILMFYFLKDWSKIYQGIVSLIPVNWKNDFVQISTDIRFRISGYIVGQMYAICILSTLYSIGLFFTGLKFGVIIGVLTGIFSLIPYVGFGIFFTTAILIALVDQFTMLHILLIVGVFLMVQAIESNFIVPKLVGSKVGLHPMWVIFGLLAGGTLLGFIGMLLAIPFTAIISVLMRYYIRKYKQSEYYENSKI